MHVHVAAGDQWQLQAPRRLTQALELPTLLTVGEQFDRDPEPVAERLADPMVLGIERVVTVRHPQHQAIR